MRKLTHWTKGSDYRDYTYDLRGSLLDVVGIDSAAALKSLRMGITSKSALIGPRVTTNVYGLGIDPNASVGGTSTVDPNATLGGNVIDPNATGVVDPNASLGGVVDPWVVDPLTGLSVTSSVYGIDPTALNSLMSKALSGPRTIESNRWDGANRLIGNTNYSGDQTTYGYDGDSNRVSMSVTLRSGTKQSNYPNSNPAGMRDGWEPQYKKQQMDIYFTNDTTMSLPEPLMATDASGNKWKQSYVYGAGGERISMSYLPSADASTDWEPTPGASGAAGNTTPKTLFYMSDVRGSAIGLLGADGSVSARYHYDEFGVSTDTKKFDLNWAGPDNLFGYTGLGYDFNSGYSYARARYIDSEVGRFISEDTYEGDLKNPQTLNLYTYVSNNPLRYVDPSGHKIKSDSVLPKELRDQIDQLTSGHEDLQAQLKGLDNSKDSTLKRFTIISLQALIHHAAQNIRFNYYGTIVNPTQTEINAASSAGYIFGRNVDLGAGYKGRVDAQNDGTGSKRHGHIFGPNGEQWSRDVEGNLHHSEKKNSPGSPPKWVQKEMDKKLRYKWKEAVPTEPTPPSSPISSTDSRNIGTGAAIVGGGYLIYRGVRILPSLIPILWPTLPANILTP